MSQSRRDDYKSYLLRLWRAGSSVERTWRASLEDALGGERVGFASLDDLWTFLRRQIGALPEPDMTETVRKDEIGQRKNRQAGNKENA